MSDYRRIVSYIYRYENGVKSTNEGYARLEIRDGQLKCTVHITSQPLRDAHVKVYFYVRKGDSITGIFLGEMDVSAGNGDFKETTEALNIMGTGVALEDTGGMLLAYVPNLFYATEWDDRPITKEDMTGVAGAEGYGIADAAPAEEGERHAAEASAETNEEMPHAPEASVAAAEYADYRQPEAFEDQTAVFRDIGMGEPDSEWEEECKEDVLLQESRESVEEAAAAGQAEAQVEYYTYGQYGRLEPAPQAQGGPGQLRPDQTVCAHTAIPETAPGPGQTVPDCRSSGGPEPQNYMPQPIPETGTGCECGELPIQPGIHNPMTPREPEPQPEPQPEPPYAGSQYCAPSGQPVPTAPQPQPQPEIQEGGAGGREALLCSLDEKPLARTMLDNFPKISPFQDTEIAECVRIIPQNIGLLPIDAWVLGSNSFLQHGFYNHKHLIFAKKYTRSGIMYLLGVPGYFTQRERNMARMFGFNNFKSAKLRPIQNGEFGYWYVPIVF